MWAGPPVVTCQRCGSAAACGCAVPAAVALGFDGSSGLGVVWLFDALWRGAGPRTGAPVGGGSGKWPPDVGRGRCTRCTGFGGGRESGEVIWVTLSRLLGNRFVAGVVGAKARDEDNGPAARSVIDAAGLLVSRETPATVVATGQQGSVTHALLVCHPA